MLTAPQIRGARAFLGWTQAELAEKAKIGLMTVKRVEIGRGPPAANTTTLLSIQGACERAGIVFVNADERGGEGVRFRADRRRGK